MAIGPRELNETLYAAEKTLVDELERTIDKGLRTSWRGGTFAMGVTTMKEGVREKAVQAEIIKRFMAAGWGQVKFYFEQRDGERIELKQ